jgi:succinylarginine dihydrolase
VVFAHQQAFDDPTELRSQLDGLAPNRFVEVPSDQVPLADAISSYLFNSQLITMPDGTMTLVAPAEVDQTPTTAAYLADAVADPGNPIGSVRSLDLRESMHNGGGPACLRLRVVLTPAEVAVLGGRVIVDSELLDQLGSWVDRHYRDELSPGDLADPNLVDESRRALDELTTLLELGPLYDFQQ